MNIQGIYSNGMQSMQEAYQDLQITERDMEHESDLNTENKQAREWLIKDEYIPEGKKPQNSAGIYKRIQDKTKTPEIQRADSDREKKSCTGNTDQVDREIEKLKQQKAQLEQQRNSCRDEKEKAELERKLVQVENELRQKDHDTYRRQHTVFNEA